MENRISDQGMDVEWSYQTNGSLKISFQSLQKGWVAFGFNEKNEILGADLFMFSIDEERHKRAEHHFVNGIGNHPKVENLGKANRILNYTIKRLGEGIYVEVTLNPFLGVSSDKRFLGKEKIYLILAYSLDSDFQHHSVYRKHFLVQL